MARKKKWSGKSIVVSLIILGLLFVYKRYERSEPPRPPSSPRTASSTTPPIAQEPTPRFAPGQPEDFDAAKRILRDLMPRGREFYCACAYDLKAKRQIDFKSCGFKAKSSRGHRIEWEHVVPASIYGRRFKEWTVGDQSCARDGRMQRGRSCARSASLDFRRMEADLYNLLPAVGELNRARANFPFGEVPGEDRMFGACDFEVTRQTVEPRPEIRGDIARIYFYMDSRYPGFGIVTPELLPLLSAWDKTDPMDDAERERVQAIEKIQGNSFFIGRLARSGPPPSKG